MCKGMQECHNRINILVVAPFFFDAPIGLEEAILKEGHGIDE
jgi:hypothetical protein